MPLKCAIILLSALLTGCVLAPKGTDLEKQRLAEAGQPYEPPVEQRDLPQLSDSPAWQDVLHRAFLANGELEAAYFDWKAALSQIDIVASYPNTNIGLGFQYMFSSGQMKAWDRTTVQAVTDPMANLALPPKLAQAGKAALENAREAGFRFQAMKFDLQRRVLTAYLDLALSEEKIRIQQDNVELLRLVSESAENRVQAGGPQQDLLKAQIEYRLAENELTNLRTQAGAQCAMLNGILARDGDTALQTKSLPDPRPLAADDAQVIAAGVELNPELAGLSRQVQGRQDALELARMAWLPDVNPMAAITGSTSQMLGAMIMLPAAMPMIRGRIEQSRAMLRASEAMARQTRRDRAASFIANLLALRNAERQSELFQQRILPIAQQALDSSRQAYGGGTVGFVELIDAQRTLLDVRLMIAEARIEREKRMAELEALAGLDFETLKGPATAPATAPATQPREGE